MLKLGHPNDLILTRLHLQQPYFHTKSHSQVLGMRTSIYLLGDHNPTHRRGQPGPRHCGERGVLTVSPHCSPICAGDFLHSDSPRLLVWCFVSSEEAQASFPLSGGHVFGISAGGWLAGMHTGKNPPTCSLKVCYFTVSMTSQRYFKSDSGPSLAPISWGVCMTGIHSADLTTRQLAL